MVYILNTNYQRHFNNDGEILSTKKYPVQVI